MQSCTQVGASLRWEQKSCLFPRTVRGTHRGVFPHTGWRIEGHSRTLTWQCTATVPECEGRAFIILGNIMSNSNAISCLLGTNETSTKRFESELKVITRASKILWLPYPLWFDEAETSPSKSIRARLCEHEARVQASGTKARLRHHGAADWESAEYDTFQSFRQSPPPSLALVSESAYHRSKNSEKAVVLQLLNRWRNRDKTAAIKWSDRGHYKNRVLVSLVCNRNRAYQRRTSHLNNINKRRIVSWNCDDEEHLFTDCPKPKVLRCFRWKREGVATTKCRCSPRYGSRIQRQEGPLSPDGSGPSPLNGSSGSNP